MVAVYADAVAPIDDVNRQLLNIIEAYKQNGSGWVFSNFVSLQLTLRILDHYNGYKRAELSLMSLVPVTIASSGPYWQACTL